MAQMALGESPSTAAPCRTVSHLVMKNFHHVHGSRLPAQAQATWAHKMLGWWWAVLYKD
jgi:hypothetical protein